MEMRISSSAKDARESCGRIRSCDVRLRTVAVEIETVDAPKKDPVQISIQKRFAVCHRTHSNLDGRS